MTDPFSPSPPPGAPPGQPVSFGAQVMPTPVRSRRRIGCIAGPIGLVIFLSFMIGVAAAVMGIWPGSLKLTAPIVCPSGFDDTFIVSDTYNPRPGETVTTFTMYCVNERGEARDAGIFKPLLLLWGGVTALVIVLSVVIFLLVRIIRPPNRSTGP